MCSIFGLLDYKGNLTPEERLRIIRILSTAAEMRGTDATGIAYVKEGGMQIQKAPRPAHEMRYRIEPEARYIMGHTRMTTQGSEKKNYNNHPFQGKAGGVPFALAHNGVLYNDHELRRSRRLVSISFLKIFLHLHLITRKICVIRFSCHLPTGRSCPIRNWK